MPLAQYPGGMIFFAHVPKAGGSSVEEYLIRRFGALALLDGPAARKGRRDLIMPSQHLSSQDLRRILPQGIDLCFAIVRDPLARLQSEFGFQRKGGAWLARLGFSTWSAVMLAAVARESRLHDNHLRPQGDLIPDGAEIYRLEDGFVPLVARIDALVGAKAPELDVLHFQRKREQAPIAVRRQDVLRICRFYAADYARFGYALPDPAPLANDRLAGLRRAFALIVAPLLVWRQRRRWLR